MEIDRFLGWLLFVSIPAAAWAFFGVSKHLGDPGFRFFVRLVTSGIGLITGAFLLLAVLTESSCTRHASLPSPDRRRIAVVDFAGQGALGDDYATVSVHASWSPLSVEAYHGGGGWDFTNETLKYPEVHWIDNSRLSIRFWGAPLSANGWGCDKQRIADIEIVCDEPPR